MTHGERMMCRLGESDQLGFVFCRLGESAELPSAQPGLAEAFAYPKSGYAQGQEPRPQLLLLHKNVGNCSVECR